MMGERGAIDGCVVGTYRSPQHFRAGCLVAIPGVEPPPAASHYFGSYSRDSTFEETVWDQHGLDLHDPDCAPFAPDAVDVLGWKRQRDAQ